MIGDPGQFWFLFVGTFIFFIANPLILNSISVIANLWFADDERARCTAICGLMAPLGSLLGLAMTGVIAAGVNSDSQSDCLSRFEEIIYIQNGITTVFCVLLFLLFREKPAHPPSKLALTFRLLSQNGIWEDMGTLLRNKNYMLTCTTFIIMWGNYITLGNVLTPVFGD